MTTLEYWEEREKRHAAETKKSEDELAKRLHDRLDALMVEMDKQIHGFYSRYAKAEGITMAEAQQRVSQMDVKAFETKAKKYVKTRDFSKEADQELRLYNATMKINRLEMLKAEMGLEMVDAFSDVEDTMRDGLTQCSLDEFERQAGILGVHNKDMAGKTDSIVNGSLNNATWSQRIWMYQSQLKSAVSDLLTNGIIQGRNPRELAQDLVKRFGATKANAERLMRTEMCRVQIESQMQSFQENGYEEFVFISTEDSHVCAVCNSLNGETFKVSDQKAGENAPPMHPNCRCSTAAYMDRAELEKELFGEENSIQRSAEDDIIQAGGTGSLSSVEWISTPGQRAEIIREAIAKEDAIYASDLRAAYYGYRVKPEGDLYDVVLHGAQHFLEYEHKYRITAETLAYIISGRRDYQGHEIRLLACSTGKKDEHGNCVAQQLANILKVRVKAPIDKLKFNPDGSLTIGKKNLPPEEGFIWFDPQ